VIRYQARWVFTGQGEPVPNGRFTVHDGRYVEEDPGRIIPIVDLGDVAVIPGLINAHTHLEFSDLNQPVEPQREFAPWIEQVIQTRRSRTVPPDQSIERGLQECRSSGTTALAEIATSDWGLERTSPVETPQVLFFREFLGLRADSVTATLNQAQEFLEKSRGASDFREGLSPHAPYSLHPQLFQGLCRLAQQYQVPVTMHLAESPAELQLLAHGSGPLVDLFSRMGLWRSDVIPLGTRPLDFLRVLAELPRVLLAHGNLLDDEELDFIAKHPQMSVVYCPRTHAAMQQGVHPWEEMQRRGIPVAIGTDSRASNPDLSLWNELRFLHARHPERRASDLLSLATANAAQALGLNDRGAIRSGSRSDFQVVLLPESSRRDPQLSLFQGTFLSRGVNRSES